MLWLPLEQTAKAGEDCGRELVSVCVAYCPADLVPHLTEQVVSKRESLRPQDLHPSVSSVFTPLGMGRTQGSDS